MAGLINRKTEDEAYYIKVDLVEQMAKGLKLSDLCRDNLEMDSDSHLECK